MNQPPPARRRFPSERLRSFINSQLMAFEHADRRARLLSVLVIVLMQAFLWAVLILTHPHAFRFTPDSPTTQQSQPREGAATGR